MKILIISVIYPPEIGSGLAKDLANGFKEKGHEVIVVTSYPRYLSSETKNHNFETLSIENGIKVIRIKTLSSIRKAKYVVRGISQLLLPFLFFRQIKKNIKFSLDVVIISSPPLPLGLIGNRIKKHYGAKFILSVQDIFPQNAIDLGILKNKLLIKFFESIEKRVYKDADIITFNSENGRRFLIEKKGLPAEKVVTISHWINPLIYQNLNKNISFRKEYNLEGKFIFLFAGTMGPAQGLEFIVKVAKEVSNIKDIVFLLVGDGMEKEKIQKMAKKYALSNVIFKPYVSQEIYPYLLKDIDVGMVCLSPNNKTFFIPGKFMGYLAAGLPIIAFLNKGSDGFSLVREANCGYACLTDDLKIAAEIVRKVYNEKERVKDLGENGKGYALSNLTVDVCVKRFEELFKN